jgi:hypothetical protein
MLLSLMLTSCSTIIILLSLLPPPCSPPIVYSIIATSGSWGGTRSWLGCMQGLSDALSMISRRCHSMYWFLASPRSSIPSSVGISISHDSSETETT